VPEVSFMTEAAAAAVTELAERATLVPTTTRTARQLARVRLPGTASRYAVAANGGLLLVDGVEDPDWSTWIAGKLAESVPFGAVWDHVERTCDPEWTLKLRDAHGLFCYAVLDLDRVPAGFTEAEARWAGERGWRTCLQGRKFYWVPTALTKSAAVAEVARRTGAGTVLAAGDSLLDSDLLAAADMAIHPRHGALRDAGWSAPHASLTLGTGLLAGEEIAMWFVERARHIGASKAPGRLASKLSNVE
jgi:hypothetical protein